MITLELTKDEAALIRNLMRVRWEQIPTSEDGKTEELYDSILNKFKNAGFGHKEYSEYLDKQK